MIMRKRIVGLCACVVLLGLQLTACVGGVDSSDSSILTPIPLDQVTIDVVSSATTSDPGAVNPLDSMAVTSLEVSADAFDEHPTDTWTQWPAENSLPWQLHLDMSVYENRARTEQALDGITVILDPGHGGKDPGAIANDETGVEILEKDLNLQIASKMESELRKLGAKVIMTRQNDSWVSLYQRVVVAGNASLEQWVSAATSSGVDVSWVNPLINNMQVVYDINDDTLESEGRGMFQGMGVNSDVRTLFDAERQTPNIIYISVHCNSTKLNPDTNHGLQVYYSTNQSIHEAENESIMTRPDDPDILPINPNYQWYDDQSRQRLAELVFSHTTGQLPDLLNHGVNGIRTGNYAFTREINIPSILLECGYMSSPENLALLMDDVSQQKLAEGLADAVYQYFCPQVVDEVDSEPVTGANLSTPEQNESVIADSDSQPGESLTETTLP
ncbi:MAG: N-acetylmuramoyl-L-alanine amidase family protein [Fastidiosipilaceae bacterium]